MSLPGADPELLPDNIAALALIDLRAYLTAIARIDPSNTGSDGHDEERYAHRNVLIVQALASAMAAGLPCGISLHAWDRFEASPLVFIELPDGSQLSWHLPWYHTPYDGHTAEEKYARIRRFDQGFRQAAAALQLAES